MCNPWQPVGSCKTLLQLTPFFESNCAHAGCEGTSCVHPNRFLSPSMTLFAYAQDCQGHFQLFVAQTKYCKNRILRHDSVTRFETERLLSQKVNKNSWGGGGFPHTSQSMKPTSFWHDPSCWDWMWRWGWGCFHFHSTWAATRPAHPK